MINSLWMIGAIGYYSSLVIWIVAQRTSYFHGKYSHSWMIGTLLITFGAMQIAGGFGTIIALTGLIALVMPLTVTLIDVNDHRREGRGMFGHHPRCWMEQTHAKNHNRPVKKTTAIQEDNWSSR